MKSNEMLFIESSLLMTFIFAFIVVDVFSNLEGFKYPKGDLLFVL